MNDREMRKVVRYTIIFVFILVVVFIATFVWRTASIDSESPSISENDLKDIDNNRIVSITVNADSKKYNSLTELEEVTLQHPDNIKCSIVLKDGRKLQDVSGYITNGDDTHAELKGNIVHIVIKKSRR